MPTIPTDAVEPGDILLVTQRPNDALAKLIVDLDQSPSGFSHAGVAGEEKATIVCSNPLSGWSWEHPADLGGVYHLSFEHFFEQGQAIHRLRLPDGFSSDRAREQLKRYPRSRGGAFGWAKCVMVAATLHALASERRIGRPAVREVVRAAMVAGEEWRSPDDFYCAEFVAYLYGLQFTEDELRPPHLLPTTRPAPAPRFSVWDDVRRQVGEIILRAFSDDDEQSEALKVFGATVKMYDPEFFTLGFNRIEQLAADEFEKIKRKIFHDVPSSYVPPDRVVKIVTQVPELTLPDSLVTPRMLEQWGAGTDVIDGSPETGDIGWKPYEMRDVARIHH